MAWRMALFATTLYIILLSTFSKTNFFYATFMVAIFMPLDYFYNQKKGFFLDFNGVIDI